MFETSRPECEVLSRIDGLLGIGSLPSIIIINLHAALLTEILDWKPVSLQWFFFSMCFHSFCPWTSCVLYNDKVLFKFIDSLFFSISFLFFLRCLQYPHLLIFGLEPLVANCDRTSFWSPSFPPAGLQTNTRMSGISLHENTFLQNSTGSWHDRTHHMPAPSCTTRLLEICSLSSFQHISSYLSHYVKPRNCRKLC